MLSCTHLVLYVKDVSVTHDFYVRYLRCLERRYAPEEDFLSVAVGDFILNFYGSKLYEPLEKGYSQGVAHVGLELPTRRDVHLFFKRLGDRQPFGSGRRPLRSVADLAASQRPGPYRFYVKDPDGYTLELHSWEGGRRLAEAVR